MYSGGRKEEAIEAHAVFQAQQVGGQSIGGGAVEGELHFVIEGLLAA